MEQGGRPRGLKIPSRTEPVFIGPRTIRATIRDDDLGVVTAEAVINLINVAPVLSVNSLASISEDGYAMLNGTVADLNGGTQTITVDWGDNNPSSPSPQAIAAGTPFTFQYACVDDNPTSTRGVRRVYPGLTRRFL